MSESRVIHFLKRGWLGVACLTQAEADEIKAYVQSRVRRCA